ncbi:hypothetical protein VTN96DRAFT_7563 [Rasamsonia emersonii]
MWLDRLSGHSPSGTPPPFSNRNRSYSPAARRSSRLSPAPQNARPALNPRSSSSSSLLATPNESTTSLSDAAGASNGVVSKPGASRPRPAGVPDPLEVLNRIIGKKTPDQPVETPAEKPAQLVEDIDFEGLSLEEFAASGKESNRILHSEEGAQTIQQFERERDKFQDLHNAIADCDEVLKSVESYLADFQTELGVVSAEIESLQTRSIQLNAKLENRRNVERLLGPAVEEISISPKAVRAIAEGPIDENWVKALNEIEARAASIENKSSGSQIKAIEDVKPLLTDLKNKAVERIRDYLVSQIKALRSPNINAQVIQQQNLVKYKDLYSYLLRVHPTLAEEITQAYVNTMRWYYLSNFTRYSQALDKLKLHQTDRNDLLAGDPSSQRSGNLVPGGHRTHDPFTLGRRIDVLKTRNHMAISSYVAEEDKSVHGFEVPFRNFNLALVDNVSAEYSFMTEMFSAKTFHQISRRAIEIFEPLFALGQSLTKQLIENTTDCLGVLICVRLNQHMAFELQRRKVPVADSYINATNMQLWPRFQQIMDLHCESLKKAASNAARSVVSALSLTADDAKQSSAPHFLTQRFGQLLHGILALSNEAGDDEPVSNSLARLTAEFDSLLAKLSRGIVDAKSRERFLYNNYSLILTIISDTDGKLAVEQKEHFNEMLKASSRRS